MVDLGEGSRGCGRGQGARGGGQVWWPHHGGLLGHGAAGARAWERTHACLMPCGGESGVCGTRDAVWPAPAGACARGVVGEGAAGAARGAVGGVPDSWKGGVHGASWCTSATTWAHTHGSPRMQPGKAPNTGEPRVWRHAQGGAASKPHRRPQPWRRPRREFGAQPPHQPLMSLEPRFAGPAAHIAAQQACGEGMVTGAHWRHARQPVPPHSFSTPSSPSPSSPCTS